VDGEADWTASIPELTAERLVQLDCSREGGTRLRACAIRLVGGCRAQYLMQYLMQYLIQWQYRMYTAVQYLQRVPPG
jgi:hypothetical protein